MLSEIREQQVIRLCQDLIKKQSNSGQELKVVECLKEVFQILGFDDFFLDRYGNVIGHIKGNKPGKSIIFDGHIDTVPVPDTSKWQHDPFGGEIEAGKIYGRGASDMKGAVSAMICAASFFAQDTKNNFAGDIYVAGVVYEELFEGIASRAISERIKPDYVVIGEASELNLKRGQRGRAEIVIETFGRPAHSANPQKGINAVYKMSELISKIRELQAPYQEELGYGILELTDIKSSPFPGASVVPDYCKVTYDRRLLVGESKSSVLQPISNLLNQMAQLDPEFNARVSYAEGQELCFTGEQIQGEKFFPGWTLDEQDEYVQKVIKGLKESGLNPEITQYSFCTNGSHYAGEAGIKTIGFGPSRENLAHIIDEYIEIDQLLKAANGYYAIIKSVLT